MGVLSCSVDTGTWMTSNIPAENLSAGNPDLDVPVVTSILPNSVRITTSKSSRIRPSHSSHSALSGRHPGRKIPHSSLPTTPPFFSSGSTTRKTLDNIEAP